MSIITVYFEGINFRVFSLIKHVLITNIYTHKFNIASMHATKGCYSVKIKSGKTFLTIFSAKVYTCTSTFQIYPHTCTFSACPLSWLYLKRERERTRMGGRLVNHASCCTSGLNVYAPKHSWMWVWSCTCTCRAPKSSSCWNFSPLFVPSLWQCPVNSWTIGLGLCVCVWVSVCEGCGCGVGEWVRVCVCVCVWVCESVYVTQPLHMCPH